MNSGNYNKLNNRLKQFLDLPNAKFIQIRNPYRNPIWAPSYDPGNQYKWGDFDQDATQFKYSEEDKKKQNGRIKFSPEIVEKYCSHNGIKALITGHQDIHSCSQETIECVIR